MAQQSSKPFPLKAVPQLAHESLYIGIDIGKAKHVAGFVSITLLQRYQRFEGCPAFVFEQSREGFRALIERIQTFAPLEQCFIMYVRYNQGIRRVLTARSGFLHDTRKTCRFLPKGAPHDRDPLGTIPAGGTT